MQPRRAGTRPASSWPSSTATPSCSSDALGKLVAGLGGPDSDVGLTTGSLRLYDDPETLNSAGNPVHYLGLSWAGGLGVAASEYEHGRSGPEDVASGTGAATVARADRFAALGGFCEPMFAYCEDTDLSLRCWQRGWRVVLIPDAVVLHRYEFSRNPLKLFLLERNRQFMVLTVYSGRLLAAIMLPFLAMELAMLAMATRDGWAGRKLAGWWWLLRHAGLVRRRRREVQAAAGRARRPARPVAHRGRHARRPGAVRPDYAPTRLRGLLGARAPPRPSRARLRQVGGVELSKVATVSIDRVDDEGIVARTSGEDVVVDVSSTAAGSGPSGSCATASRRRTAVTGSSRGPSGSASSSTAHSRLELRSHVDDAVLYDEEHSFGTGDGRINIVDAQGRPVGIDNDGRLQRTFETRSAAQTAPLLDSVETDPRRAARHRHRGVPGVRHPARRGARGPAARARLATPTSPTSATRRPRST